MTEREKELLRMALIYTLANMDDVLEAFEVDIEREDHDHIIEVNGDEIHCPNYSELQSILLTLQ